MIPSRRYWLSVWSRTVQGRFNASSAAIAAISSMRLFVVMTSKPDSSFSVSPKRRMAPQPPGPGLPLHAPSVKMSTIGRPAPPISRQPVIARSADAAMKAQFLQVLQRVLRPHHRPRRLVEPIVEPRQKEAQCATAREERQRGELGGADRPHGAIIRQQQPRFGDIEAAITLETPGVQADRDVVSQEIAAREVEINQPRDPLAAEEHVVGKEIGMNDAARQTLGPCGLELRELARELVDEAVAHFMRPRAAPVEP